MDIKLINNPDEQTQDKARYAQKKNQSSNLWYHLEDSLWFKLPRKKTLPWYGAEMDVALSKMLKY